MEESIIDGPQAELRDAVGETARLRRRARDDRHASSVPLLVLGALTIAIGVEVYLDVGSITTEFTVPAAFFGIWCWYRRQEIRTGVGPGRGSYLYVGLAMLFGALIEIDPWWPFPDLAGLAALFGIWYWYRRHQVRKGMASNSGSYVSIGVAWVFTVLLLPILISIAPLDAMAVGLLVVAVRQSNRYLGVSSMIFAVISALWEFIMLGRGLGGDSAFVSHVGGPALILIGLLVVTTGLYALRRERAV